MEVFHTIDAVREALRPARTRGQRVGFVPTMGFLHDGHLSLMHTAREHADVVAVSIFVNPTQFGPGEDFDAYPRALEADLAKCREVGVDVVFAPERGAMYRDDATTTVAVAALGDGLCGRHRPGHFDGVTTVVTKLFNIIQPDVAVFGQKDYQQLAIIRRMVRDLDMPIEIIGAPTQRHDDGLARSSRNANLTPEERAQAKFLYASLRTAQDRLWAGTVDADMLADTIRESVAERIPLGTLQYVELIDPDTLAPVRSVQGPVVVAVALQMSGARLIDNLTLTPTPPPNP